MAVFKCKMCGGTLDVQEGMTVCECEYCGTEQTIPTNADENVRGLFNRANTLRMKSEFDKAEEIYEKILQISPNEAEAYWGLILCKYGVEYVEDPKTFKRIPTCHRTSYDSIIADDDYKSAIENADISQRAIYEAEAKRIGEIQKQILTISQKEDPYDVFICYKETDDNGTRTQDSVIANDIYYELTQAGFKVFYSAITLEDKLGSEYEPFIFSALNSAKVMLVLGTKPEYFNAVWVKNEWSRFLKIMKKDRSKLLIPCYRDMDAYELPEEFAHLQAQDMSKIGFINDVVRGIKKVIGKEEEAEHVDSGIVIQQTGNASLTALLDRGIIALEDREWNKANDFFDQALNLDAKCGEAYLGQVLAKNEASNLDEFVKNRLSRYKSVSLKKCSAGEEDTEKIEECVKKYVIKNRLDDSKIRSMFEFSFEYSAEEPGRKEALKKERIYLENDKLITRADQFLEGNKKEDLQNSISKIIEELELQIESARSKDSKKEEEIKLSYITFLSKKEAEAAALHEQKLNELEEEYQRASDKFGRADTEERYNKVAEWFDALGDYKDSKEKANQCRTEANSIRLEKEELEKKLAKKKNGMILIFIIGVAVVVLIASVNQGVSQVRMEEQEQEEFESKIIGHTFKGDNYELKILDSEYCTIEHYSSLVGTSEDEKARYYINRENGRLLFDWYSDKVPGGDEPFYVEIDDDQVTLYSPDFVDDYGMYLEMTD